MPRNKNTPQRKMCLNHISRGLRTKTPSRENPEDEATTGSKSRGNKALKVKVNIRQSPSLVIGNTHCTNIRKNPSVGPAARETLAANPIVS
jgi:hypothetical protein